MTSINGGDPYHDAGVVAAYDQSNPAGIDHDFFVGLANAIGARTVVDLGCGTGLLTVALARVGRDMIGIDPSASMIEYARRRPGGDAVTWIVGDASVLIAALGERRADLVIMSGNVAQHILGEDWPRALRFIHDALRPGGLVAFESRNPETRAWERWTEKETKTISTTSEGRIAEFFVVNSVVDGEVTFAAHNLNEDTGDDRYFETKLAFRTSDELTSDLTQAGFRIRSIDGGWSGEPVTPASEVYVVTAYR